MNICPICGREKDKCITFRKLQDVEICKECGEKLRVMYPIRNVPNPDYKVNQITQYDWNGSDFVDLEDNGQSAVIHTDGMSALSLGEYQEKLKELETYRTQIRKEYGNHDSVFQLDGAFEIDKINIIDCGPSRFKRFLNTTCIYGHVIVGTFQKGDMVTILHDGQSVETQILFSKNADYCEFNVLEGLINCEQFGMLHSRNPICKDQLLEGHPAVMVLDKCGVEVSVEDRVVKD